MTPEREKEIREMVEAVLAGTYDPGTILSPDGWGELYGGAEMAQELLAVLDECRAGIDAKAAINDSLADELDECRRELERLKEQKQ